eukprot:SAG31_NODE_596_length_13674_cov_3.806409_12_plen_39_part_00
MIFDLGVAQILIVFGAKPPNTCSSWLPMACIEAIAVLI